MLNIACHIRVGLGVGLGGEGVRAEPFRDIRKDEATGRSRVRKAHEPMVDVFEEEDHTLVVAEMPGVGAEDIRLDFRGDTLTLSAERGQKRYRKEVLLPGDLDPGQVTVSYHNGVAEIRCLKPASARDRPGGEPRRLRSSSG